MKYALIGCGRISPNHIEAAKNNHLEFAAICDIDPEVMEKKAALFHLNGVHKYTDYKELLAVEKPELVAIATESGKHAVIALDCIEAGCNVIIEKPIALSIADADAIIAAGEKAGVVVCANHQNRFNKSVQYMRKALEEGRFGRLSHGAAHVRWNRDCIEAGCNVIIEKPIALSIADADAIIAAGEKAGVVVCANHQNRFNKSVQYMRKALEEGRFGRLSHGAAHVRWNRGKSYYEQAPWRGTWAQDGGCLMNQCIHNIDLLRWFMGDEIDEVMAYTDQLLHPYLEAEDLGMALVKFSNGSYGLIEGTTNVFPRNLEETLYLFGEKGTAKAAGTSDNIIEEWRFDDDIDDPEEIKKIFSENPPNIYGFGHTPLYADVIEAIKTGRPPLVDARAGKRALELVLAIYKSAAEHRPVKLPLKECSSMDFAGRFDN